MYVKMMLYKNELMADCPMRAMNELNRTMPARGSATESCLNGRTVSRVAQRCVA